MKPLLNQTKFIISWVKASVKLSRNLKGHFDNRLNATCQELSPSKLASKLASYIPSPWYC